MPLVLLTDHRRHYLSLRDNDLLHRTLSYYDCNREGILKVFIKYWYTLPYILLSMSIFTAGFIATQADPTERAIRYDYDSKFRLKKSNTDNSKVSLLLVFY